jgi:hypothetical protein
VKADEYRFESALTSHGAKYVSVIVGQGMTVDEQ